MNRRGFLAACLASATAPYVVTSAGVLMPVAKVQIIPDDWWDALRYNATTQNLSEQSLEDMIVEISKLTDDRGLRIQLIPASIILPTKVFCENYSSIVDKNQLYNDCKRILSKKRPALCGGWTTDER